MKENVGSCPVTRSIRLDPRVYRQDYSTINLIDKMESVKF